MKKKFEIPKLESVALRGEDVMLYVLSSGEAKTGVIYIKDETVAQQYKDWRGEGR